MELRDVFRFIDSAEPDEVRQVMNYSFRINRKNKKPYGKLKDLGKPVDLTIVSSDEFMGEPYRLAKLLWFTVKENYPFMKEPNLKKWADAIEKINRLDKREWKAIQYVIVWVSKDDFWKQQVRSGDALRRHFETLMVKILSEQKKKGQVHAV